MASPIVAADLRAQFKPAFDDTEAYPDAQLTFYINFAYAMIKPNRWGGPGAVLDMGAALFAAHWVALAKLAASNPGGQKGIPGTAVGIVTEGHVDKVGYSRSLDNITAKGAGHWNLTVYGLQFWQMVQMMGMGPVQVGLPFGGFSPNFYNGAWFGPWFPFADGGGDGFGSP